MHSKDDNQLGGLSEYSVNDMLITSKVFAKIIKYVNIYKN